MKETQAELPDRRVNPIDAVFMLSIVLAVGVSFIWLPRNITITIMLLLGAWGLSVYFKRIIGVGIGTIFADLPFVLLVFVGSRWVSLISKTPWTQSELEIIKNIIIISSILALIWLGNLSLGQIIEKPKSEKEKKIVQIVSLFASLISFLIVMLSLFWGVI